MRRIPLSSASLQSIGYDAGRKTLEVEFSGSRVYQYHGVPLHVYQSLMASASRGGYFARHVRGRYPHTQLGEWE